MLVRPQIETPSLRPRLPIDVRIDVRPQIVDDFCRQVRQRRGVDSRAYCRARR
jgi:hypothetical protein